MSVIKIILPAGSIKDGTVVTKVGGTKLYTIHSSVTVRVHPSTPDGVKISPETGARVLVPHGIDAAGPDKSGVIQYGSVLDTAELVAHVGATDALILIDNILAGVS